MKVSEVEAKHLRAMAECNFPHAVGYMGSTVQKYGYALDIVPLERAGLCQMRYRSDTSGGYWITPDGLVLLEQMYSAALAKEE